LFRGWAYLAQAVWPVLCSIEVLTATERKPLKETVIELSKQQFGYPMEAFQVFVADLIPVWMDRIGITYFARSGPRVQRAGPEDPFVGSQIDERLTNVEDAFQAEAESAHFGSFIGLGAPDRQMSIAMLGKKRPVVCHQQRRAPKQTIHSLRPSSIQDAEYQPFCTGIIGILNKLSQEGSSVAGVLINVRKEVWMASTSSSALRTMRASGRRSICSGYPPPP
jgi:hypothetical protein